MYQRNLSSHLRKTLEEPRRFIHVLLGPRQVGKTTMALAVAEELSMPFHYISADAAVLEDISWIITQWEVARENAKNHKRALFIIDEVQKIPHWSEIIKKLWDEDTYKKIDLKVVMLGSSPWLIQKGMQESLAGRFEVIPVPHWSFEEMHQGFQWGLNEYIYFGGYPGSAPLVDIEDPNRWKNYITDSLIETTISRDVLLMTQVNKPALLRRLFHLGCLYSGQVVSYQKLLGQLLDAGNTTTLAHYLELLSGAGLLTGVQKFAGQVVRSKGSSPKFMVYNTALISAQTSESYLETLNDPAKWGHLVESSIGAYLLNSIRGTKINLYYWREGNKEVDFILQAGKKLIAIEVKSGKKKDTYSGLAEFNKRFSPYKILLIGENGIPIKDFLSKSITHWFG